MPIMARDNYLETEVLTATPQKLRLMLIEAAIRFTEQTRQLWRAGDVDKSFDTVIRAQQVVTELMSSLNHESDDPLTKKLAGIYLFVFRSLVDANLNHDEQKLDDAIRVLEVERETWRQVCQQTAAAQSSSASFTPTPSPVPPPLSGLDFSSDGGLPSAEGFSLDA